MEYRVKLKKSLFKYKFLELEEAQIEVDRYDGGKMELSRLGMVRSEVVALLLKNVSEERFVFVEQFRYSAAEIQSPWVTEIVAGIVDPGEDKKVAAVRECMEETGYRVENPVFVKSFMPSVGLSNQVVDLFYGEVKNEDKKEKGGGLIEETEDIRVVEMGVREAMEREKQGEFIDVKTVVAMNWYALNRA